MARVEINQREAEAFSRRIAEAYYEKNGPTILRTTQSESPVDTGLLRRSHSLGKLFRTATGWAFQVIASTDYAAIVYKGWETAGSVRRQKVGRRTATVFTAGKTVPPNKWILRAFRRMFSNVRDLT